MISRCIRVYILALCPWKPTNSPQHGSELYLVHIEALGVLICDLDMLYEYFFSRRPLQGSLLTYVLLSQREKKNSFITWRARISIPDTQRCQLSMMRWCQFCYFLQHWLSYLHVLSAVFYYIYDKLIRRFYEKTFAFVLKKLTNITRRSINMKQRTPKCLTETLHLKKHLNHHPDIIQTNPQPDKTLSFK